MTAGHELGAMVGRFASDNDRRRRIFAVAVPVGGTVAFASGLLLGIVGGAGPGAPVLLPGAVCGIALGSMLAGLQHGWRSRTRRDETFTLYEGGFTHSYAGSSQTIHWGEIAKVAVESRDNALWRALGAEVRYRVKLKPTVDGRRVVMITGITLDADRLGWAVYQAVHHGDRPRPDTP